MWFCLTWVLSCGLICCISDYFVLFICIDLFVCCYVFCLFRWFGWCCGQICLVVLLVDFIVLYFAWVSVCGCKVVVGTGLFFFCWWLHGLVGVAGLRIGGYGCCYVATVGFFWICNCLDFGVVVSILIWVDVSFWFVLDVCLNSLKVWQFRLICYFAGWFDAGV